MKDASDFSDRHEQERVKSIFYIMEINLNRIKSLINKEPIGFACYNLYVCIGEYNYCLEIHKKHYVENRKKFEEMVLIYINLYKENNAVMKKDISKVFLDRVNSYKETTQKIILDGGESLIDGDFDNFETFLLLERDDLAFSLNALYYLGQAMDFTWVEGFEKRISEIDHEIDPIRKKYLKKYTGVETLSFYDEDIHPPTFSWRKYI